jgi:hypothetical protein
MQKIPPQQERVLNIVFGCLLILSLLLFAGIPALGNISKTLEVKTSASVK